MDATLLRIRELINQQEQIEAELTTLIAGTPARERKTQRCSICNNEGHSARTCPEKAATAAQ